MTTGELIKKQRNSIQMTQKQLADLCGMADSAIRKYESGRIVPKVQTLEKIAKALNCKLSDLIPGAKYSTNESRRKIEQEYGLEKNALENVGRLALDAQNESLFWAYVSGAFSAYIESNKLTPKDENAPDFYPEQPTAEKVKKIADAWGIPIKKQDEIIETCSESYKKVNLDPEEIAEKIVRLPEEQIRTIMEFIDRAIDRAASKEGAGNGSEDEKQTLEVQNRQEE